MDTCLNHAKPAEAAFVEEDGKVFLALSGDWLDYSTCPHWKSLVNDSIPESFTFRDNGIGQWNTALVTFAFNMISAVHAKGGECDWHALPKGVAILLNLAFAVPEKRFSPADSPHGFLEGIGKKLEGGWYKILDILDFVGLVTVSLCTFLKGRSQTKWSDIFFQIARSGPQALGIISLIGTLIGVILSFIGCIPLRMFGAEIYVATLVGIGSLRMMAATTVGTVMAGRTGAAFAAEIGSMQTNEEIDAYIAMGLSPFEILVLPRFIALSVTVPLLCIYCDLMGIIGGLFVGVFYSKIGATTYLQHMYNTTSLNDFFVGIFTSWVFGLLISCCGCYHGLHCGRNSTAVGQAATSAVVSSIVCMVIATAIITLGTVILHI